MFRNRISSGGRSGNTDGVWSARSQRSSTGEEGRPRWGDRGVATGRLWEPTAPNARLPQVIKRLLKRQVTHVGHEYLYQVGTGSCLLQKGSKIFLGDSTL